MAGTNQQIANKWVRNMGRDATAEGRTSNGNMSFVGRLLYSYSTPIAHIYPSKGGFARVLLTTDTYSTTTEGKHKGAVRKATNYGRELTIFNVPHLLTNSSGQYRSAGMVEEQHRLNLLDYGKRIAAEEARLARAKVHTSRDYIKRLEDERADYAQSFGLVAVLHSILNDAAMSKEA